MARKFVSPGVFTQELDQSFIATGVGAIGAAVVGLTAKGPGLVPTQVVDFNDFVAKFGDVDPTLMAPYAVKNYLKNSATATVVRVVGDRSAAPDPTKVSNAATYTPIGVQGSGSDLLAVINILSGTALTVTTSSSFATAMVSGVLFTSKLSGTGGNTTTVQFVSGAAVTSSLVGSAVTITVIPNTTNQGDIQFLANNNAAIFAILSATLAVSATTVSSSAIVSMSGGLFSSYPVFSFSGTAGAAFTGTFATTVAFLPSDPAYIGKSLNTDPLKAHFFGHWLYKNFQWQSTGSGAPYSVVSMSFGTVPTTAAFDKDAIEGATPWVRSQNYGGNTYQLFRFWHRGEGAASNVDVKISIANVKSSLYPSVTPYGTFDVIVRAYSDIDSKLVQLESFTGLTLDPTSPKYLPRVIGDEYMQYVAAKNKNQVVGTYTNYSDYVRVEMSTGPAAPTDALPWGHDGYPEMESTFGTGSLVDVPYVLSNLDSNGNLASYTHWGVDFSRTGISDRLKTLIRGGDDYPVGNAPAVQGAAFSLHHLSATTSVNGVAYSAYTVGYSGTLPSNTTAYSFTLALRGGFDGFDETQVDPLAPTGATAISTVSLKKALLLLGNPDEIDLNLLAIPGVTNPSVTSFAEQMCNNRADVLYIMDMSAASVVAAISALNTQGIDDNYAATYYPSLRYADTTNNVLVTVPPSVAVLGAIAYNDRVGQVFFAPAGLNRGGLAQFGIVDTLDRLTFQDRNDLYENRINPIATFPNEGIVIWGQKTLQVRASALDRVNVRRLLIYAKKTIASVAKYLVFEPNNPATWDKFVKQVNPILDKVRMDQGLERFKVVMDSTVNTPDLIDRNVMTGKIFLQPTRTAEYIDLSFVITASGVQFEE